MMQMLSMSMGSGNVGNERRIAAAAGHGSQQLVQARRLAGEPVAVVPGVGEDLLHVVARLVEGNGLDVDRAFERLVVGPAARAARARLLRPRGEDRVAP